MLSFKHFCKKHWVLWGVFKAMVATNPKGWWNSWFWLKNSPSMCSDVATPPGRDFFSHTCTSNLSGCFPSAYAAAVPDAPEPTMRTLFFFALVGMSWGMFRVISEFPTLLFLILSIKPLLPLSETELKEELSWALEKEIEKIHRPVLLAKMFKIESHGHNHSDG